jgi:hypothetical protein
MAKPVVQCRADLTGQRAILRVTLVDLFDQELLRLVELGLEGEVHVEATLYRRRRLWFDARLVQVNRVLGVSWSRLQGTFLVAGLPVADPDRLELPEMVLSSTRDPPPDDGDEEYVEISARLEVVTARSLGQVARWLVGGKTAPAVPPEGRRGAERADPTPPLVPRALVEYLAADLARTSNGRCPLRGGRRK